MGVVEDENGMYDDITLPPRRPTMISAKCQRRNLIRLCHKKLKYIDIDSSYRQTVLISNMLKRLQKEEDQQRKSRTSCGGNTFGVSNDFLGGLRSDDDDLEKDALRNTAGNVVSDEAGSLITYQSLPMPLVADDVPSVDVVSCGDFGTATPTTAITLPPTTCTTDVLVDRLHHSTSGDAQSRKRSLDMTSLDSDATSCNAATSSTVDSVCNDVFSHFYRPPTPMPPFLLNAAAAADDEASEDEDVNVVDVDAPSISPTTSSSLCSAADRPSSPKRFRGDLTAADRLRHGGNCKMSQHRCDSSSLSLTHTLTTTTPVTTSTSSFTSSTVVSSCIVDTNYSLVPTSLNFNNSASSMANNFTNNNRLFEAILGQSINGSSSSSFDDSTSLPLLDTDGATSGFSHSLSSSAHFSCGQSSMLSEYAVFHNYIASFES